MPRGKRRKRNILHSVEFPPLRMRDSSCVRLGRIHELGRFAFVACSMGSFVWVLLCWVTSRSGKELSEPSWERRESLMAADLHHKCRVYSNGYWLRLDSRSLLLCKRLLVKLQCSALSGSTLQVGYLFWVRRNQNWRVDHCLSEGDAKYLNSR